MRIRNFRSVDIPAIAEIQQLAATEDGTAAMSIGDIDEWLRQPEIEAEYNVFVITDDDDEENMWGQAGTLEGIEGEMAGYTVLQMRRSRHAYHFLCQGAVKPEQRRRGAGRALLICGLNRARSWLEEFEWVKQPVYFEALLPVSDVGSEGLAAKCEMQITSETALEGMQLYRREL